MLQWIQKHPQKAGLTLALLYLFGNYKWITCSLQWIGTLGCLIFGFALYFPLFKGQEYVPLKHFETPADKLGLFTKLPGIKSRPYLLALSRTWEDTRKSRAQERLWPRPPTLLSSTRPKSNISLSSDDLHASNLYRPRDPITVTKYHLLVGDFIRLINRDFVQSWFSKISPEPILAIKAETTMYYMASELTRRFERVDIVHLIISKLLPAFTTHVREVRKAERLLRGERLQRNMTELEELDYLLARCYKAGKLHPALSNTPSPTLSLELTYLRNIVKPIVPLLLPQTERAGKVLTVLVREILACKVLQPILESMSDPDTWNQIFEMLADKMIQAENNLAKKMSEALERLERSDDEADSQDPFNRPPSFEEYMKQIKQCDNLLDALRIRDVINTEIMRKKGEIAGCGNDDIINGIRVSDTRIYINRLALAQKRIDKRIKALGGKTLQIPLSDSPLRKKPKLIEVLENPHLLSAFAEFMDTEGRLPYLQFWMTATGIEDQAATYLNPTQDAWEGEPDPHLIADAKRSYRDFFLNESLFMDIDESISKEIRECFARLDTFDPLEIRSLRWLNLLRRTKDQILNQMEIDYNLFIQSPAYLKIANQWSAEQQGFSDANDGPDDYPDNLLAPPRPSNESERSRSSDNGEDERSRKPFKVTSMFKKTRKADHYLSEEMARTPSRKDGHDNVETELKSILTTEDKTFGRGFFKRSLSRNRSGRKELKTDEGSDTEKYSIFRGFKHKKSPSTSSLASPPKTEVDKVLITQMASDDESVATEDRERPIDSKTLSVDSVASVGSFQGGHISDMPLTLMVPKRVIEIDKQLAKLDIEYKYVQSQTDGQSEEDSKTSRQLSLMKTGLEVEMSQLRAEKLKIEQDELENILAPDRITIHLPEARTMEDEVREGKRFTVYPIQIQRSNPGAPSSSWTVFRRYSEFESFHGKLKALFPAVAHVDFPGNIFKGIMQMKKQLIENRRKGLEKYLQNILQYPDVCKNVEVKKFLCHEDILRRLQNPTEPISDLSNQGRKSIFKNLFPENPFDFISRIKSSSDALTDRSIPIPDPPGSLASASIGQARSPGSDLHDYHSDSLGSGTLWVPTGPSNPLLRDIQSVSATDAVIDLFIELFELKEKNNWLRRQAVVLLLQQLFGGTVERRVTENLTWIGELESSVSLLEWTRGYLWPNGVPMYEAPTIIRTNDQKKKTKADSQSKMIHLFPELLGSMVGRQNAKRGAERLVSIFQNRRLNQQLMYTLFDELMSLVFPELRRGF